jgi:isopentenyl-diphosphate delta-isomerase type 1
MKRHITDNLNEMFIVVDKNDKVVEYRTRAECHQDKSLIHRAVGLVIFNKNGQILLQKRSLTKDLQPGFWAISSAGHVSKGETYEQAAKRELAEELGISIPVTYLGIQYFEDDRETEMHALFQGIFEGPFQTNLDEVDRVEFFSKEKLTEKIDSRKVVLSTWAVATLRHIGFLTIEP